MSITKKVVLKFGGSVLHNLADFEPICREIQRFISNDYQILAVVSAFYGVTEKLIAQANLMCAVPSSVTYAELIASGEFESASKLVSYLVQHDLNASLKTPLEFNFIASGNRQSAKPISINTNSVISALEQTPIIVMPGFSAIDEYDDCILLGRGGSDISAVYISEALGLDSVRLLKDVDGLYDIDPNEFSDAKRFQYIDYDTARRIGGALIQTEAIDFAASKRIHIDIAAIGQSYATRIGPKMIERKVSLRNGKSRTLSEYCSVCSA